MRDRKGKKKSRRQSALSRALASSNKPQIVRKRFFEMSASEIRANGPRLSQHRHFRDALKPNRDGASGIYKRYSRFVPLEKCVSWCLAVLEVNSEEVNSFNGIQDDLLLLILNQNYPAAIELVGIHEEKYGVGSWSVSLQGALRSSISSDAKLDYQEAVNQASKDNAFFKALSYNLLNRFDNPETAQSENRFLELKIKRTFKGRMLHFLMYKLIPYSVEFVYDFESILDIEKNASAVDVYLCLVEFVVSNLYSDDEVFRELSKKVLIDLRRNFKSGVLDNLAVAMGLKTPEPITDEVAEIIESYTSGDYTKVCESVIGNKDCVKHFSLVEVFAKSVARLSEEKTMVLPHITPLLVDLLAKTDGYEKAKAGLMSYSYSFEGIFWFKELRYFIERETKFYDDGINDKLKSLSLLLAGVTTPAKLNELSKLGVLAEETLAHFYLKGSVTRRLFDHTKLSSDLCPSEKELEGVDSNRRLKYIASWCFSKRRYAEAVPILEDLSRSSDVITSQWASRSLVEAYRLNGEVEKAAKVYVQAVLENINLLGVFDSTGLSKDCIDVVSVSSSIAVPIVLSLHSSFIIDSYEAALKYSFECFLKNNGVSEPLELFRDNKALTIEDVYFLRYVCVPEVMKLYLYFDSAQDIEKCRVEICKFLLLHFEGDEDLVSEIKHRTGKLVLREAVNQVQGGRIFSDANFHAGISAADFKSLYNRYEELRLRDFSVYKDEVSLKNLMELISEDARLLDNAYMIHLQDLVLNEKNNVFLKLIKLVRDEFAFGEKGLNFYLSTRIRHGHFPTTIRRPLIDNYLLASKATDTSAYKMAEGWKLKLRPDPKVESAVESAIVEFSLKFNELVDEVNDNWLRVFTIDQEISGLSREGELGGSLLNYSVSAIESYKLQGELGPSASYREFIALASKWLWARTEQNLSSIRKDLSINMRSKANGMLNELGKALIQKFGIESLGDFPDALVRARNGLGQAFDNVEAWFWRAEGATIKSFELDIPVQIASMAADVEVDFDNASSFSWRGSLLNPFVDCFFILFENAVSKSGLSKDKIDLSVYVRVEDDTFYMTFTNKCVLQDDIRASNEKLDIYRNARSSRAAVDVAQAEGGSGFFKLWHLLEKDMGLPHSIDLGFVSENLFEVNVLVPLSEAEKGFSNENTSDRR